jgi:proteic killer suppression protein
VWQPGLQERKSKTRTKSDISRIDGNRRKSDWWFPARKMSQAAHGNQAGNPFRQPVWRAGIGRFVQAPGRLRTIRSHWMIDTWHVSRDTENTIKSFRHKGLKRMFENGQARLVNPSLRSRVENILAVLDASPSALDLATPGNRLHELTGDQAGVWSVAVSGNGRIVFRFTDGNAYDVDLVDYH